MNLILKSNFVVKLSFYCIILNKFVNKINLNNFAIVAQIIIQVPKGKKATFYFIVFFWIFFMYYLLMFLHVFTLILILFYL